MTQNRIVCFPPLEPHWSPTGAPERASGIGKVTRTLSSTMARHTACSNAIARLSGPWIYDFSLYSKIIITCAVFLACGCHRQPVMLTTSEVLGTPSWGSVEFAHNFHGGDKANRIGSFGKSQESLNTESYKENHRKSIGNLQETYLNNYGMFLVIYIRILF